tara:strand:- start:1 stop:543 length:543 start_codon:yes stop_codon:yes gene_type:complete
LDDDLLSLIRDTIRTVPDFPIEGIMFRDISPVLSKAGLLTSVIDRLAKDVVEKGWVPDVVIGPEARGFIFGPMLAERLGTGFVPVRKPGKLPSSTIQIEYELEYGSNILEMHDDALEEGQKTLIADDLLATGGTISACADLCKKLGAKVTGAVFLIELEGLGARESIAPVEAHALISYPA